MVDVEGWTSSGGYLDDAYFLGWATLQSSLEIFDLHKPKYKGNHRKMATFC